MKKIYWILGAALLCLAGCDKAVTTTQTLQHLKLDLTINNQMAPATKAVKTGWADGDKVYVFFGKPEDHPTPAYLTLTRSGSSWTETWTDGLEAEIAATPSGTLTAVYSPIDIGTVSYIGSIKYYSFSGENYCFALSCNNAAYTVSAGVLSATLDLALDNLLTVQFFLPGEASNAANLTFSNEHIGKIQGAARINESGEVISGSTIYGNSIPGFAFDGGVIFSGILIDTVDGTAKEYTLKIVDNKGTDDASDDVTYTYTKKATISQRDAILLRPLSEWSISVAKPDLVDLGLTSGVKWATFNLGATKPEEFGYYFAWGETTPKSDYRWATYFDTDDGGKTFKKYSVETKTALDLEDDAAHAALGGKFRLPTPSDFQTLKNECDWVWTTTEDGVNGYLVTGKKEGYTDKSIFLPAAGHWEESRFISPGAWSYGYYWSSVIVGEYSVNAGDLFFLRRYDDNGEVHAGYVHQRRYGFPIRPVSD